MYYLDSHLHLNAINGERLEEMYLCGIREVVSPAMPAPAKHGEGVSPDTIKDMWDNLLEFQIARAKGYLIKAYVMVGVSMVSTPREGLEGLLEVMPDYLKRPEVVAIGEIGFEPNSPTCSDLNVQEKIFRSQLNIAEKIDTVVDVHVPCTPEPKKKYTKKSLEILKEYNIQKSKVIIDHCSEDNIEMVLAAGYNAAITVQVWRNVTPEIAADLVIKYNSDRLIIDSDNGGSPDHLAVPKTAMVLRKKGFVEQEIEKVCWLNGKKIYGIE